MRQQSLRDRIVSFASRSGGASAGEVTAWMYGDQPTRGQQMRAQDHLQKAAAKGRLVHARRSRREVRYFGCDAEALRWIEAALPKATPGVRVSSVRPAALLGEADTSRAHYTTASNWTHDVRYQCAPGEQPFGAGFAAVGVGRSVDTGGAW